MDIAISFIVIVFGALGCLAATRGLDRREVRYAGWSYACYVLCGFLQWALTEFYYGISDAHRYVSDGELVARALQNDFVRFAPEVLKYAFHAEYHLPVEPFWQGTSGS